MPPLPPEPAVMPPEPAMPPVPFVVEVCPLSPQPIAAVAIAATQKGARHRRCTLIDISVWKESRVGAKHS